MEESIQKSLPDSYEVIKKIGRGGTADIYLAHRQGSANPVVLKIFYDPSAKDLVRREEIIAQKLNFPGIVRVHGSDLTSTGEHFLRMEYCQGSTLEIFPGKVSEKRLLSILSAVAVSLNVLHQAGFVHNDLKPSNIFCPEGFEGEDYPLDRLFFLKIGDFSLAEDFTAECNSTITGTVGYMSPEMILKKKITPSSDLFSLGVMAYELACGSLPFGSVSDDPLEINARITEGDRPPLCGPGKEFSQETSDLILSLLELDPAKRPSSAFELTEILSKLGSPYPYRSAIRPRHLISGINSGSGSKLTDIFGRGSFSPKQIKFIEHTIGFDVPSLRILLEENFDRGNFARMDGCWGWKNDSAEIIEWSRRQIRFGLRPLRGMSISTLKMVMALAIIEDFSFSDKIAVIFGDDKKRILNDWANIPRQCRPSLLHSLRLSIKSTTRRALSSRLIDIFRDAEEHTVLTGKLLYNAGQYREAIDFLKQGIEKGGPDHDQTLELIELSLLSARKLNDLSLEAHALLNKAHFEKDSGRLDDSERTYLGVMDMLEGKDLDSLIAQTCKELGNLYKAKTDYQSGINILNRALELYNKLDDKLGLSHTLNALGNMHWIAGDLDQALVQYKNALKIQKALKSDKEIATSLNNIGVMYVVKGEYEQGIEYYNQSLEIRKRLNDKAQIAQTWNNMGATYFLMGYAIKALEPFRQALEINREIGTKIDLLFNIENLAEAMIQAGRLNDAFGYLKEGTSLADELNEASHQCTVNRLTGQLLRRMGFYDDAETKLKKALQLARQIENKALILMCYLDLARIHKNLHEIDVAIKSIDCADEIAREVGDKSALSHTALIRLGLTGQEDIQSRADDMLQNLDTERDKAILYLTLLEHINEQDDDSTPADYLENVKKYFSDHTEDIDLARFRLAAGATSKAGGNTDEAMSNYKQALDIAKKQNLLPEQWQATCALSELMFEKKDFESSFKYARATTDTLKKIAVHISDRTRLGRFYNDERITELLGRIKSLQAVLGKTKGAAVGSP